MGAYLLPQIIENKITTADHTVIETILLFNKIHRTSKKMQNSLPSPKSSPWVQLEAVLLVWVQLGQI